MVDELLHDRWSDPSRVLSLDPPAAWHVWRVMEKVFRRGGEDMNRLAEARLPSMRGSIAKLLELIPDGGCRKSDLARDAGVTKQAVGPRLSEMAALAYITMSADPEDRRAQIVEITGEGRRAREITRELTALMEAEWEAVVGKADYAVFRSVLDRLADRPSTISPAPT